jgi:hypothetical protein
MTNPRFPDDYTNFRELAVKLMRESRRPDSPHAPHIRALTMLRPAAEGVGAARAPLALHSETFPPEYLHVLGSYLQVGKSQNHDFMFNLMHQINER